MCTSALKKWALLLTFWAAIQLTRVNADQTITGNLSVSGNADIEGTNLTLGTNGTSSTPGMAFVYNDGTSTIELDAAPPTTTWKWQQNGGTSLQLQMTLDGSNKLTLYNQATSPNPSIVLNPTGSSTFSGSLSVNGTDNEMPHQTLLNANSILTRSLADSRYIVTSPTSDIPMYSGN